MVLVSLAPTASLRQINLKHTVFKTYCQIDIK